MSYWMDFYDKSRLLLNMVLYRSNIHRHYGCLCKTRCRNSIYAWKKISFYLLGQSLMKHILRSTVFVDFIVRFVSGSGFWIYQKNNQPVSSGRKTALVSKASQRTSVISFSFMSQWYSCAKVKWKAAAWMLQPTSVFFPSLFFFSSLLFELENKTWGSRGCWRTALPLGHRKKGWAKWTTLGQFCWGINGSHFPYTEVAVLVS